MSDGVNNYDSMNEETPINSLHINSMNITLPTPPPPLQTEDIENIQRMSSLEKEDGSEIPSPLVKLPPRPLKSPSLTKIQPPSYTPTPPSNLNRPLPPNYSPKKFSPPPNYVPPTPTVVSQTNEPSQLPSPKKSAPPPSYFPPPPIDSSQSTLESSSNDLGTKESNEKPEVIIPNGNVLSVSIPQRSPSPNVSGRSPSLGSFNDIMTKKLYTTSTTTNNVVNELKTDGETCLLQWNFDKSFKNSLLKLNTSSGTISWSNNNNWALARSNIPLSQESSFIEVERVKGISQLLQFGVCKGKMNFNASPPKMELSPLTVDGEWIAFRIKSSMKGDKIGILYDLKEKKIVMYKNAQEISSNPLPDSFTVDLSEELYPMVFLCGDIELKITENPELEKYINLSWSHGKKSQFVTEQTNSSKVSSFLEQIGLDKLAKQPKFEKMEMSEFITVSESDLRKLNVPLQQRKRIMSSIERQKLDL